MKNRTLQAVDQQIAAMGCEVYEIGLYKPHTPDSDSREPEMLPRTWDRATLLKSVPWLRYQNSQGRNIYIRPKGEHNLSMVDDLTADAINRMKADGFAPCLVVETSPGNFQAWLNHGEVLPQRLSTLAARTLAKRFGGDKGAADWRHFGRLAGFTNRKAKHQSPSGAFPFVRIIESRENYVYSSSTKLLADVRKGASSLEMPTLTTAKANKSGRLLTIDDFRCNPKYVGDGNRIDLAYALYAISRGIDEASAAATIHSRDLSKRGTHAQQLEYTKRTVEKATRALRFIRR